MQPSMLQECELMRKLIQNSGNTKPLEALYSIIFIPGDDAFLVEDITVKRYSCFKADLRKREDKIGENGKSSKAVNGI